MILAAHPDPPAGINLGVAYPATQRLSCPNTQLDGYGLDRRPLRAIARSYLGDHPDRTLPQLRRIFQSSHAQDPIAFSTDAASGHAGGIQSTRSALRPHTSHQPTEAPPTPVGRRTHAASPATIVVPGRAER